jgi:quercetin dioxygenase-like cupin family protein
MIVDTAKLKEIERRPGWRGRFFDSANMSFAYYSFTKGSSIHAHNHEQEEVWHVIDGTLEITVGGVKTVAGPGMAAIVPPDAKHEVVALSDGRAIIVDYPLREAPKG